MPATIYTDLAGEGDLSDSGSSGLIFAYRVFVTDIGMGHKIDLSDAARYVDIGWTALFEEIPDGVDGPEGTSYFNLQWVEFIYQTYVTKQLVDAINGASGIHYSFKPGVVATITVYLE